MERIQTVNTGIEAAAKAAVRARAAMGARGGMIGVCTAMGEPPIVPSRVMSVIAVHGCEAADGLVVHLRLECGHDKLGFRGEPSSTVLCDICVKAELVRQKHERSISREEECRQAWEACIEQHAPTLSAHVEPEDEYGGLQSDFPPNHRPGTQDERCATCLHLDASSDIVNVHEQLVTHCGLHTGLPNEAAHYGIARFQNATTSRSQVCDDFEDFEAAADAVKS